jgi:AraC family transcriptional regulator
MTDTGAQRLPVIGSVTRREYVSRINRVLDYIETHLHETLTLERLAEVAHFSPYHFHRVFVAMVGETLNRFIARVRIERTMQRLVAHPERSITAIALDSGFASSQTFARAFREHTGMSATAWRMARARGDGMMGSEKSKMGNTISKIGEDAAANNGYIAPVLQSHRSIPMSHVTPSSVTVNTLPDTPVAYVRHIGPYAGDEQLFGNLFARLCQWAGPRGLIREGAEFITIYHDDPNITAPEKLRTSVCLTVPAGTPVDGDIGTLVIPAGNYAFARFEILPSQYGDAWNSLCGAWLPDSGYEPADGQSFEIYRNDPAQHPEHKHIVDICIPVKPMG